jgi:uncharacterized protein (DUF488 family)
MVNLHPSWSDPVVIEVTREKKRAPVMAVPSIYTIGHSNHPIPKFIDLLKRNRIEVVVDVRSKPYSRFAQHFKKERLQESLRENDIKYLFLGAELGGKPEGREFYDEDGKVLYERIAATEAYKGAIARLLKGIQAYEVAILCSEEDPGKCHRSMLVGKTLFDAGVTLRHIRGNGELQVERSEVLASDSTLTGADELEVSPTT